MKLLRLFLIVLSLASLFAAACTSSAPTNGNTNTNQTATVNANANLIANATAAVSPSPAVSPAPNAAVGSPSATVAAYHQAMIRKDEMAFRNTLSQATLREFTQFAKEENAKSLLEYWTGFSSPAARLQTRSEQIAGDAAIVEIGNDEGAFVKHRLVKENGAWKMDLTEAAFRQLR